MNTPLRLLSLAMLCVALRANAQQPAPAADPAKPPPKATPQSEAGEPRADTSATPAPAASSPQSEAGEPRANTSRPAAARSPAAGARTPPGTAAKNPGASDRLELGTATVTGDREQPKVLYIVPWKKPDIGDLAGKPLNSLVDEILAPVDRDVFKREVVYYKAVQADASQNGAPSHPPQQGEK